MLNKETKKKIDNCRDILVGVLPLPSDQVELITISLIYKFMDDIDEQSRQLGGAVSFFGNKLKTYSWQNLMSNQIGADERVKMFVTALEELIKAENIPELFKSIFRNTFLKFRDGQVFKRFLDEINYFSYDNSEELGNAFEYLLNTMGAQGENGQFRTPRNIIDFIVEVVDPDKDDKILDPACGTAGFLISSYKHILRKYTKGYENYRMSLNNQILESNGIHWGDKLLASQKSKLAKRIEGYDNTPLMVRLSQVNMYLHHFPNPSIHDYDSISYKTRWNDKYDCILANPPFMTPKGGVKAHDQFRIRANKTEILFSDYIIEHLTPNGKAGWIVPEGIIFQNSNDYVELRKWLINDMGLWAVVSLPAQIFQPYSGVKTSILLVDRALARSTENIILVKIENDGFSLNTNRNPIKENDLPDALNLLTEYKKNLSVIPSEESNLKYKILHRKDFAKLNSYKATTTAIDFCKKEFNNLKKAEEKYQEMLEKELTEKQKQKAEERIKNHKQLFFINTGFNSIPSDEKIIKLFVEEQLKDQVILYGEDSENHVTLSSDLKKAIDWQREYNLSIDKYNDKLKQLNAFGLTPLGNICEVLDYRRKPVAEINRINGEYPYYGAMGIVDWVNEYIFDERLVLIAEDGGKWGRGEKKAFIAEGKYWVNNHAHIIRLNKEMVIDSLVVNLLNTISLDDYISGAVVPKLTQESMRSIPIPLPPLEFQQNIVEEIEQYQKVIDGCNLVIQNYKPSFKIEESWEKKRLGDLEIEIIDGDRGSNYPTKNDFMEEGFCLFLNTKNVRPDGFLFDELEFISAEVESKLRKGKLKRGDIVLTTRGTLGNVAIYDSSVIFENIRINSGMVIIRSDNHKINSKYLFKLIQSSYIQQQIDLLKSGVAQPQLPIKNMVLVEIPIPPVAVQQKIVDQIQSEMQAIEQCKQLKTQMENKIKEVMNSLWQTNTIISPL